GTSSPSRGQSSPSTEWRTRTMSIPIGPAGGAGPRPAPKKPIGGGKDVEWASWVLVGLAIATVVTLAVLASSGFGSTGQATTQASASSGQAVTDGDTVPRQVSIEGMLFAPNTVEIPAGSTLVLEITNNDSQNHDLALNGINTGLISPGDTVTQDFGVFDESTAGWCTVAGHKAMGMTFDVTVTGATDTVPAGGTNTAAV